MCYKTLRFARVMFGLTCRSYLLNAKTRAHVEKHLGENTEKLLLQFVRDLYVDDTTFNDLTKATEFYHLTKSILAIGGFNLRKWETKNLVLCNVISQEKTLNDIQNEKKDESTYKQSQLGFSSHAFRKVLGLNWDTNNDFLVYKFADIIAVASKLEITKRNIPRVSAMFYDPLGLICPIVLQFRLIFQSLCAEKLEWDSSLPLHHSVQWKKLLNNLTKLRTVSVKRYLLLNPANDTGTVELHGLCDSSSEAYGVAMYIRGISKSKQVHTTL